MTTRLRGMTGVFASVFVVLAIPAGANTVTEWHALATQCISLGVTGTAASRPGPPGLLDFAVVQAAVHDAIQAIEGRYEPYLTSPTATGRESVASAAAAAAHRVLSKLCPNYTATLDAAFKPYLDGNDPGLKVGFAAGDALLEEYRAEPVTPAFIGGTKPGEWRPTPPGNLPMAFVFLATTHPFTLNDPAQFRPGPFPPLGSLAYLRDYNEVKRTGSVEGHPDAPACPAPRRTDLARFYSGNFISQWHEVVRNIAVDQQLSNGDAARLLALSSLATADAAIAAWDSKIHYDFWRPITAIREGDNDLNNATVGDPSWTPFIQSIHFPAGSQTPNYPDYVSGANGLVGAVTSILQLFFETDKLDFAVYRASPASVAICTNPRTYQRFSEAADDVVDARIWLGIHFRTADDEARRLGRRVALWTFTGYLQPTQIGRAHV